jgi:hypothetical protein
VNDVVWVRPPVSVKDACPWVTEPVTPGGPVGGTLPLGFTIVPLPSEAAGDPFGVGTRVGIVTLLFPVAQAVPAMITLMMAIAVRFLRMSFLPWSG